jgi:hypothetical protein
LHAISKYVDQLTGDVEKRRHRPQLRPQLHAGFTNKSAELQIREYARFAKA